MDIVNQILIYKYMNNSIVNINTEEMKNIRTHY